MSQVFTRKLLASEVEQAYADPPFALGTVGRCLHNGQDVVVVMSKNVQGSALALGDALKRIDFTTTPLYQTSNVYVADRGDGKATLKGDSTTAVAAVAKNQYAGCSVFVTLGTGLGQVNSILEHDAVEAGAKITLVLARPFATAPATTDDFQILPKYHCDKTDAIKNDLAGVALCAVPDGYYFWRAVEGDVFGKIEGTSAQADGNDYPALLPSNTAGYLELVAADATVDDINNFGGAVLTRRIGTTDGDKGIVRLKLPWN